jgi:hypothetical protein
MYVFCKAKQVFYLKHRAVVKNTSAVHSAENLMLVGDDKLDVNLCRTVDNRVKGHFKPAVA